MNILALTFRYQLYYNYDFVYTSAGGLLVPKGGISRPVASTSSLAWFIWYIYVWNVDNIIYFFFFFFLILFIKL